MGRRHFGSVRQRDSGRWQVRYRGPDGLLRSAPETFARKSEAERYLTLLETRMINGDWVDPLRGKVMLEVYAADWITHRAGLRPRTVELYRWILGRHIAPTLGRVPLAKLDTPLIREWRSNLLAQGVSEGSVAKAYRLLRAILTTAVDEDRLIAANPCRIKGAGQQKSVERPVLTLPQVFQLVALVPERWQAFILLKTFASLRWGEITALTRADLDLVTRRVRVRRQLLERRNGAIESGPTKSRAGNRSVAIPELIVPALVTHLGKYTAEGPLALVFAGLNGQPLRRSNFNKSVDWRAAVDAVGVPGLHLHDLRHTGNMLAAATGASLKDLMTRMGHDSPAAALIYQHASAEADAAIADAINARLTLHFGASTEDSA
ncbi:tyrosine-type recombinase/integrase [Oryzihumus leptocrescens]|uniref:Site-specific recombinase XerD n=1 Tax=Oryzihumus leptocrescens TaxID=297536 RepID=A0A542Z948_9MICO|nr:tyrosine-type recombinase/integrase [Oryzihumus leptocrescens]TQL56864.1 site-specific recombinase XerD [Oryzihumus leptocrescens]